MQFHCVPIALWWASSSCSALQGLCPHPVPLSPRASVSSGNIRALWGAASPWGLRGGAWALSAPPAQAHVRVGGRYERLPGARETPPAAQGHQLGPCPCPSTCRFLCQNPRVRVLEVWAFQPFFKWSLLTFLSLEKSRKHGHTPIPDSCGTVAR